MNAIRSSGKLVKVFPNGVTAVDGIDLVVGEDEIVGFVGPNGAGKSTTTRIPTTSMALLALRSRIK